MSKLEKLLTYMKFYGEDRNIQRKQTEHRIRLVEVFDIRPGDNVLEIGCGQGDTTVVLADAVGEEGHVHAVDIGDEEYGAPVTLGEATDYISRSPIGRRITFNFKTDVTAHHFQGTYDAAVLSHSLLYFSSTEELAAMFQKLRQLAGRICVAEWDLEPTSLSQTAHAQAILLQGLFAQFNQTDANVRTIVTKESIQDMLSKTGWSTSPPLKVSAADLDDVTWEADFAEELEMEQLEPVFSAYKGLLSQTVKLTPAESLDSFVINGQ